MIIDWDAHHGNGTEAIFYDDPTVLYSSIHQHPLYPGTGKVTDTGTGLGEGYTVNVPVPSGTGHATYLDIINEILIPAGKKFRPDAVIISAGQDSHEDDPLTDLRLCSASYHAMTRMILDETQRPLPFWKEGIILRIFPERTLRSSRLSGGKGIRLMWRT